MLGKAINSKLILHMEKLVIICRFFSYMSQIAIFIIPK